MTYDLGLAALADPTRRELVELLRDAPRSVGDLTARVGVTQPAVSQHLRVLRDAGLVESRRDGARRIYRLRRAGLVPLRRYVESFWEDALRAYEESFGEGTGADDA